MLKEDQGAEWLNDLGLPCLWVDVHGEIGGSIKPKAKVQNIPWADGA
jgi:thiamine biosynthesis lipoprotein